MAKEQKMKFKLLNLSAKEKEEGWTLKIKAPAGIAEAKVKYTIDITVDEEYFANKVQILENKIAECKANPDMFGDFKSKIASYESEIKTVKKDEKDAGNAEIIGVDATVLVADFSKDILTLEISEDRIEEIIKLRHRVVEYVVNLK